jgi:hypothetical protein
MVGHKKGTLEVWGYYYKELLISLDEGMKPEERFILDHSRILELLP